MTLKILNAVATMLGGIGTTLVGMLALDETLHTWPTILIAVGVYSAATGLRNLQR